MLFIEFEDKLDVEKLFEDLPEQPAHPDLLAVVRNGGGVVGIETIGGETYPVGPFPGMGGLIRKGSFPEGVIIWLSS